MAKKIFRRHHVKFYTLGGLVPDGMGGTTQELILFHSCRAELKPQTSKEVVENMRTDSQTVLKVNIPFREGILPSMKMEVVKTGKKYEIVADPINRDMKNRSIDLLVKEEQV